jgi:hypothetical protein
MNGIAGAEKQNICAKTKPSVDRSKDDQRLVTTKSRTTCGTIVNRLVNVVQACCCPTVAKFVHE